MTAAIAENFDTDRVRAHTEPDILHHIDEQIEERIRFYATQPKEVISRRINELDQEWDMERYLEVSAASLGLATVTFGLIHRRWLLLTGTILGSLLMHGLRGWCPPVPILRRFGVRTCTEIDREKYALKILRGDFEALPKDPEQLRHNPASEVFRVVSS